MKRGSMPDVVVHRFRSILESPSGFKKFKKMIAAVRDPDSYLRYFQEIVDRGYGKTITELRTVGDDGKHSPSQINVILSSLDPETLKRLADELSGSK